MNHLLNRTLKRTSLALLISATISVATLQAADVVKNNNTNALNLTTSWVGGVVPTATDVALWDSTVTAANTAALGASLDWQGIRIASPGGAIVVTHTAGQSLSLGTAGIDMSAATQNLTLLNSTNIAGSIAIGGNQTWNVQTGRTLQLFSNSNTQNQRLTGSGNIEVTGGGIVRLLTGDAGSTTFVAGNGNDTYTGNWTITNGSVRGLRNGTHAFGQGSITMNGGTLGQEQGNWVWTNNITLNTATTSTFDDFNGSGTTRSLKLQGVISGSGTLNINDTSSRMDANNGFILTGTNTLSGTVNVGASGNLRIGGVVGNDTTLGAGTGGTLGTAAVVLNATGTLTLSRNNSWTFANNVSGGGVLNIGGGVSGAGTQVVTVSGTNTYTGATTVSSGRLDLTGTLTSAISVSSGASISGSSTGSTTGTYTSAGGAGIVLPGGGTTTSFTANGATIGTGVTTVSFLTSPTPSTTYDVFTYGAGGLTLTGTLSAPRRGSFVNDVPNQKMTFVSGAVATRTWNTTSGTWDNTGTNLNWVEGDQKFFDGDSAVFGDIASDSTITLSGAIAPGGVTVQNTANTYTFGTGTITGTTGLTKTGAGGLTLSNNANSFTGNVAISGGTVTTATTQGGGVNSYLGAVNGSRTISVSGSGTLLSVTGNNLFGGVGKTAATIPTVSIDGATVNSTRFNILGNVTLNNGATLSQSTTDTGGYEGYEFLGSTITVSGSGVSSITTGNSRQNHLAGLLTTTFNVADTTGNQNVDLLVSAGFRNGSDDRAGAGSLAKTGIGTMNLAGTNTYTGTTSVLAGTLLVNGTHTGAGAYTIAAGATLGGTGSTSGAVTVNGTFAPGASIESFATGALSLNAGSTFAYELDSSVLNGDLSIVNGNLSIAGLPTLGLTELASGSLALGSKVTLINYSGAWDNGIFDGHADDSTFVLGSNTWLINYNDTTGGTNFSGEQTLSNFVTMTTVAAIPEPGTLALGGVVLLGFTGVGLRRRRMAKRQA